MSKHTITHKYYRPGTLIEKGTKLSLKTQPYINGVIFDIEDPISSFHWYIIQMKEIVNEFENMIQIPGIKDAISSSLDFNSGITGKVKLLLDYLAQSPIEITIKDQIIDKALLAEIENLHEDRGQHE